MAIVRIDPVIIQQLLLDGMKTIAGVTIVVPGQATPEDADKWVRLVGIDYDGDPRSLGDGEPHHDGVTARLEVGVSVAAHDPLTGGSAGALASACSAVAAGIADWYGAHAATGHTLQMQSMALSPGMADPEQPAAGIANLTGRGRAERVTGNSVKTLP